MGVLFIPFCASKKDEGLKLGIKGFDYNKRDYNKNGKYS